MFEETALAEETMGEACIKNRGKSYEVLQEIYGLVTQSSASIAQESVRNKSFWLHLRPNNLESDVLVRSPV